MNISRKMSLIVVASVILVTLPSLWFYYQNAKGVLLQDELEELKAETQKTINQDELLLQLAEPSLSALSRLLNRQLDSPSINEADSEILFDHKMMQFDDGAWRNRKQHFDGRLQTGLFLPADSHLTPQAKQFYLSALDVFDMFGASTTINPIFDNVWMLGHDRSELIFNLTYPDFIYLMPANTDYTKTPWMTLASTEQNPDRALKWTPALFDPVTRSWIISAVYPLDIEGKWRGTLGVDININQMIKLLYLYDPEHLNQQHFLLTAEDDFVLAGQWQHELQQNPETFKLGLKEQNLQFLIDNPLSAKAELYAPVVIEGKEYQVIASSIAPMMWRYYRLVPTHEILKSLENTVLKTSLLILFTVILLAVLIHLAVKKIIVRPLTLMSERANAYANDRLLPAFDIKNNDEISDLNHALQSMYDDLSLEKKQLLDSEQRYRRVVTQIQEVIVQIDGMGAWQFLSPVWTGLTGYELSKSINKPVNDFIHPAERHLVERTLVDLANNTVKNWLGEVRLLTAHHGFLWVNISLQQTKDVKNPSETFIVGTIENIHNKRLERAVNDALRAAEKKVLSSDFQLNALLQFVCEKMMDILGVALFWIKIIQGGKTKVFYAGSGSPFLFDVQGAWPGLADIDDYFQSSSIEHNLIRLNNADNQPESWHQRLENDGLCDGVLLPFNFADTTTGVIGVHSIYRDKCGEAFQKTVLLFTEGLRVLCKLTEDQYLMRLHRVAVENTANSIMIINVDRDIEWVNDAFIRLTLFQADEVIGLTPSVLKGDINGNESYTKEIWQTLSTGNIWQGEQENYRKDGKNIDVYQTITPLLNEQGDITHFVAVIEDITERKENEKRIAFMATHDELTKLPNRNLLHDRIEQAISHAIRNNNKMAVLFIDIDHFKFINDSLGHQIGDELLKVLAKRFIDTLRKSDTVARFGGDEFVVILPEIVALESINGIVSKLLQAVQRPYHIAEHELIVTGSLGISIYPDDSENADDLIQHADSAMYLAKQQGRNNSQFYTAEINEKITRRLTLEKALRQALELDQFIVYYQPKIDLVSYKMTGLEALVRWQHPKLGLISPIEFIPLAEETGIILALGDWVMLTACRQMHAWEQQYPDLVNMSINVSARQFWQPDFSSRVALILAESQVTAEKIELELTESMVMNDVESVIETMNALKMLDISLSLDDFGTGYSSLSYLQRFPVDVLKMDRCFVTVLQNENADSAMVRSILALAENFNLSVVAEGIENVQQQRTLTDLGCHYGQGYLYSRPVDAAGIEALLNLDKVNVQYFNRDL
ncbi:hypothetical protein LCGC14_0788160 [marine sediment metagenome]|uniref:Diguanylate cyclase/phosphodiesterase with PAS/PAC sensor(S) n=1 Tax=marine sediment metagenome TaxID=412755 RepID=A0A0F9T0I3_9ZZZZ|nr:EAL domain-containing protein [Methylophaga sp.]HEC59064.1 EAL domain-containing protein [Methylophaga sp.]